MGFSHVEGLIEDHDIVLVGYRGVDGSVVLDSPELSEHFRNLPGDMLGDAALKNMATAYSQCAQRLQDEGIDTNGYTVIEVIDDMEATRSALGYDRVNLLSVSYGTRLAMIYAWKYPGNIHRSAMIGVNPPGHFVYEPEIVDEQINYYAALFAEDPEYSSRTDDLAQMMREVSHNMPDRWLLFPLNAGMIKTATFESLANTSDAAKVFDIWLAAAKGDYSGMALLTLAGPMMFAEATVWGDNAAKAVSIGDYDFSRDYATEMNPPDSIIGSPRSIMADAWKGWTAYRIPEEYSQVQPSDVETLLISGSIDFFTPAEFATDELLPALSNGQQVILSEFGHSGDVWNLQPEATRHLLTSFFATGEVDDSLYTYHTVNFNVGLGGFPAMAKIAAAVVVLVIAGLGVLVWFIVQRMRRRRARLAA
jgi:pimeloyl-ACP methyl ester carboxylesterase